MSSGSGLLLVGAVAGVGVLHTLVPDHWVPITLLARQQGWSQAVIARASFRAGLGHVLSTLAIALVVWLAGVAVAARFGHWVDMGASVALIGFGTWIAVSAWRGLHGHGGHGHPHGHGHNHHAAHLHQKAPDTVHGPELQRVDTEHGPMELSIYEAGAPPRFRLTADFVDSAVVETFREDGTVHHFQFVRREDYWESVDEIPEPHQFAVSVTLEHQGRAERYELRFTEHAHGVVGNQHDDHVHDHSREARSRTALLLILGSSPMVEGIPAFFAASKYGPGLIIVMSLVFGATTIATYMLLCIYSTAGLQRIRLGAFERYGEVASGAFIALVGLVFWIWPVI